jgi:dihydropteroate synthase
MRIGSIASAWCSGYIEMIQVAGSRFQVAGGHQTSSIIPYPSIMGILNLTADSFSDGGRWLDPELAVAHALDMLKCGAEIIDIGAESTRPGAITISADEEWGRIQPVLSLLKEQAPQCKISIDTQKSYVAERAIRLGATMINDISALEYDPALADILSENPAVDLVLMHMQGRPQTMQINPQYEDIVQEVKQYLISRMQFAVSKGINEDRIYLDPGIGFGKKLEHNLSLLAALDEFRGYQMLLGASRKSFISQIAECEPRQRIGGSLASTMLAMLSGVSIIRVHDVFEHHQFIQVAAAISRQRGAL